MAGLTSALVGVAAAGQLVHEWEGTSD